MRAFLRQPARGVRRHRGQVDALPQPLAGGGLHVAHARRLATVYPPSMSFPEPFYRWRPHPWHGLEVGPDAPGTVTAYIEITPFDLVKYEVDKATGYLRVDRPQLPYPHPDCSPDSRWRRLRHRARAAALLRSGKGSGNPVRHQRRMVGGACGRASPRYPGETRVAQLANEGAIIYR